MTHEAKQVIGFLCVILGLLVIALFGSIDSSQRCYGEPHNADACDTYFHHSD